GARAGDQGHDWGRRAWAVHRLDEHMHRRGTGWARGAWQTIRRTGPATEAELSELRRLLQCRVNKSRFREMADRLGFEPKTALRLYGISSAAPSTGLGHLSVGESLG